MAQAIATTILSRIYGNGRGWAFSQKDFSRLGSRAAIACLAKEIGLEVVEGIASLKEELKPEVMRVVFKDAGFADDVVKTNAVQILRQAGIEDVKSL
ncbi:unnamed protein product [marine sediment metagenome]|uniref:Uncharacterized protein n=1 Tax=marine sediment metagenome TaxID=412755 RepID=X0VYP9_9ZZZZ